MFLQIPAFILQLRCDGSGLEALHNTSVRDTDVSRSDLPTDVCFLLQAAHKDQKKIQKTMSSGDLGKVEVLRKNSTQDGR